MAQHIQSIASSSILRVTEAQFLDRCRTGMAIYCEGLYDISKGIEWFTGSPWSHIGTLVWVEAFQAWGVSEATDTHGVHMGHLKHYLETYNGNICLAATPVLDQTDVLTMLQTQFGMFDEGYDSTQEASMVGHRLCSALPIIEGSNKKFCSGLYQASRAKTKLPLQFKGPGAATPEDCWIDPATIPVCALVKA